MNITVVLIIIGLIVAGTLGVSIYKIKQVHKPIAGKEPEILENDIDEETSGVD